MKLYVWGLTSKKYEDDRLIINNYLDDVSFLILLKSLIISLIIIFNYLLIYYRNKKQLNNTSFFSFPSLFSIVLRDITFQKCYKRSNSKIMISNDDVKRLKPLRYSGPFIPLQSALINENKEIFISKYYSCFNEVINKADLYCVESSYDKDLLEKYPSQTKNIIVTGQSRFGNIANVSISKKEVFKKYGIKEENKIYLWLTQTHGLSKYENNENIILITKIFKQLPCVNLIIKLHPAEKQQNTIYEKINIDNKYIVKGSANLYELLSISDVVITRHSNAGKEAAIFNIPLLILNSVDDTITMYEKEKIAYKISTVSDFLNAHILLDTVEERIILSRNLDNFNKNHNSLFQKTPQKIYDIIKQYI